jgi:hypothetical protein
MHNADCPDHYTSHLKDFHDALRFPLLLFGPFWPGVIRLYGNAPFASQRVQCAIVVLAAVAGRLLLRALPRAYANNPKF